MLDVKKANRALILWNVYQSNGISRKEIAGILGLTPAAITLITTDMISEGLLHETMAAESNGRKGRKEVLLEVNKGAYAVVGVYVSTKSFQVVCMDLGCNILFEDTIYTADCHRSSEMILKKISSVIREELKEYDVQRKRTLLGIGICVHGIVDIRDGISINSYGIWEENAKVASPLEEEFHVPVILTNNICALAHGENFMMKSDNVGDTLFIKYGPGVGAARLTSKRSRSIYDYSAVELGHLIVEPDGNPCVCGSQGCLETIVGYNAIEQSMGHLITEHSSPILYHLTGGEASNLNMQYVMEAYKSGEKIALSAMNRTIHYLALSIRNSMCLFKPNKIVLYGELFENMKFRDELNRELTNFAVKASVSYSHYSLRMNALGPATTIISQFFEEGGFLREQSIE